jgi:uroporphyrinogen-III synthase
MTTLAVELKTTATTQKKVTTILISQPLPQLKNPYQDIAQKYELTVDFRSFIHVEGLAAKDFRKQRLYPEQYSSVILTSKNAVDHFFRLCIEMRIKMSEETKYFCLTENIANYLQKFIVFRKRKVFSGIKSLSDMASSFAKHKDKETFLFPCSMLGGAEHGAWLRDNKVPFQEAMMYETVSSDLSDLSDVTYDILAFFSPLDIKSLFENFPDFKQNNTRIAVSGGATARAVQEAGLTVNIQTSPEAPSMPMALEQYIKASKVS